MYWFIKYQKYYPNGYNTEVWISIVRMAEALEYMRGLPFK